jgi:hypothetical protein
MKFWEALDQQAAGAEIEACPALGCPPWQKVRAVAPGAFEVFSLGSWVPVTLDWLLTREYRIVKPALSEAKPEPQGVEETLSEHANILELNAKGVQANREGIEALSLRLDAYDGAVRRDREIVEALEKRVEALEQDAKREKLISSALDRVVYDQGQRLSALEAKLAALEASEAQPQKQPINFHGVPPEIRKEIQRRASSRKANGTCESTDLGYGWLAFDGNVYGIWPLQEGQAQDAPTILLTPANRSEDAVAWPKGSLQWAETEAKRRGLISVRRTSKPGVWSLASEAWLPSSSRHALDWEPCE